MRRIGVLEAGALPPLIGQNDALDTLKALYSRLVAGGAFGTLIDKHPSVTPYAASPGQRVIGTLIDVELPELAPDCSIISVADAATGVANDYIFDGHRQLWDCIDALTLTSEAPLSQRDALGLLCYLAVELADEYGQEPSQVTVTNAARWQMSLTHNWTIPDHSSRSVFF